MATNLFSAFARLLPGAPLLVGQVISSASGVATVELPGGARIVVRGTASVGSRVFVRSGNIEGAAPSLSKFKE